MMSAAIINKIAAIASDVLAGRSIDNKIAAIASDVLAGKSIDTRTILYLLELSGDDRYDLFYWANRIRLQFVGSQISLCAIVSGRTGRCSQDCRFCAQSGHYNTNVTPNVMTAGQIIEAADKAAACGAHCFGIVSSGRAIDDAEIDRLSPAITYIAQNKQLSCCASFGCINYKQARRLYALGVRRYNHNLETSRKFFPSIVTTHSYDDRVATVQAVKQAGMQVCCGGIIGLGESLYDRAELAVTLRELAVDSVPLNFLNPIAGTPLAEKKNDPVKPLEALQTIAAYRFAMPKTQIKIAGGRQNCLRDLQSWIFYAGANSTMIGNYLTTTGRNPELDHQMLRDLELSIKSEIREHT